MRLPSTPPFSLRLLFPCLALVVVGCGGAGSEGSEASTGGEAPTEIEWIELMPSEELEVLLNPPSWIDEIEEGSSADEIDAELFDRDEKGRRYFRALHSTSVIARFDEAAVRLPGFAVPLELDESQRVVEFFLVPYFGACLHLPPPPPNQMIHVRFPEGLRIGRLDDAYWIEGVLSTVITDHELGTAAYAMEASRVEPYRGPSAP